MTRLDYATDVQLAELFLRSGLPNDVPPANAFRMLAHTPAVGAATLRLVFALLTETSLDPSLRELIILRIAKRCGCRYAWVQHVPIARGVKVGDAQIASVERRETPPDLFKDRESIAFLFVDEVLDTCCAADHTFAMMQVLFSPREIVEALLLIGYFRMICGVMTTLGVEVESPFGGKILDSLRDSACGHGIPNCQ